MNHTPKLGMNEASTPKLIVAQMVLDWIEPYSHWGNFIPKVILSNHPRFLVGNRLDWGFVSAGWSARTTRGRINTDTQHNTEEI